MIRRPIAALVLVSVLAVLGPGQAVRAGEPASRIVFDREIQPLLGQCVSCHGPGLAKAGLRLDNRAAATLLLKSGKRAIVPGRPGDSELLRRVASTEPGDRMPAKGEPLSDVQIIKLRQWIGAGAEWPIHWAYRPLVKPSPPSAEHSASTGPPQNPIDLFVLAKLAEHGLAPSAAADRRTLLRRLSYDLIGLPPRPEEIEAALNDAAPDWYEKIVERLLASPHYGERWARHWMDVVHFAETHGHDQDRPRVHAWPYRDYLIRSFNEDKPYTRFVHEQVAGDVLFPNDPWSIVATGFLAAGAWDESSLRDIREDTLDREIGRYLDRDDIVTNVMATFTSTTIHCARCHDHKFDPITQKEYYGLQAVFAGTDKADRLYEPDAATARRRRELFAQVRGPIALRVASCFPPAAFPAPLGLLLPPDATIRALLALPPPQLVYCGTSQFVADGSFKPASAPRKINVLKRGDIRQPGPEATPGALSCLPDLDARLLLPDSSKEGSRRAALARWLTDPKNGLTWRSIANRVWQYHFGRGLVDTPNDFGKMGAPPTHPELLDWLAVTLQESGGSLKPLHRMIVTSAAYRQSSAHNAAFAEKDADNRYLWRQNRRRLDAEAIHDAVLQISGKLDAAMGGPSVRQFHLSPGVHVTPNIDYQTFNPDDPANFRRSVYRFLFRTLPDPLMEALDCPDGSQWMPVRNASVTAIQALALLNDKFIVRQTEHIASRVQLIDRDPAGQILLLYRLALGRAPNGKEAAAVGDYAVKRGLANAARVLLNSNEFVFVD